MNKISIDRLGLSASALEALNNNGIYNLETLLSLSLSQLSDMSELNVKSVCEIIQIQQDIRNGILVPEPEEAEVSPELTQEYKDCQFHFVKQNNIRLYELPFSYQVYSRLSGAGCLSIADIFYFTVEDFRKRFLLREDDAKAVVREIETYLDLHKDEILSLYKTRNIAAAEEAEENNEDSVSDNLVSLIASPVVETASEANRPEYTIADTNKKETTQEEKEIGALLPEEASIEVSTGKNFSIDKLDLSVRSVNALHRVGIHTVEQMMGLNQQDLQNIKNLGAKSIEEIMQKQQQICALGLQNEGDSGIGLNHKQTSEYRECLLRYTKVKDVPLSALPLTTRAFNRLEANGYTMLSDIILLDKSHFMQLKNLGENSVNSIIGAIENFIDTHHDKILAMCAGEENMLRLSDEDIRKAILEVYKGVGFKGLSLEEMRQKLELDESYLEQLKIVIGKLIADGEIEYVDYRCHRVYPSLKDFLPRCKGIDERNLQIITKRLDGLTLQATADEFGLTRERVRQIVNRDIEKGRKQYRIETGLSFFDEDYYLYLFENYSFDAMDASAWLGIPQYIFNYFDTLNIKQGQKNLEEALSDSSGLDAGMRLKIRSYLNKDKIIIDGRWINKNRAVLEEVLIKKFCQNDTSFEEFIKLYNDFLETEEVPFDEKLYYTDDVIRTRENRLADARFLLWKQHKTLRYYDIDGTDFAELLDTLNLDSYENIELSTQKFIAMYPQLMEKYDIRDQYELHNLLKKLVPDGGKNKLVFGRMPMVKFGEFDRDNAILNIIIDNAPIGIYELAALVEEEYGYDRDTVIWNYLTPFKAYNHQGMYRIDHKAMATANATRLSEALREDFYYLDEIRQIYTHLVPGADHEEINPYNLKNLGFVVLSRYALRNYDTLDAYFTELLTSKDIIDISGYRKRYGSVQMFSQVLSELRRNLTVIEFEPNQLINFRKLEKAGVSRADIESFCEAVYDFVEDENYFTIQSIRQDGFNSAMFDLGFSDWFYTNLLLSDERLSNDRFFANIVFYKGARKLSVKTFLEDMIRQQGSVDLYDMVNDLKSRYCFVTVERGDIMTKLYSSDVYYDKYLDRYYANESLYLRELDEL